MYHSVGLYFECNRISYVSQLSRGHLKTSAFSTQSQADLLLVGPTYSPRTRTLVAPRLYIRDGFLLSVHLPEGAD